MGNSEFALIYLGAVKLYLCFSSLCSVTLLFSSLTVPGLSKLPCGHCGKAEQSPTALHLISRHTTSVCKAFNPLFSAKSLCWKLKNLRSVHRLGFFADLCIFFFDFWRVV